MIGPDGIPGYGGPPPISDVGASGYGEKVGGGVRVELPHRSWPQWLRVEAHSERVGSEYRVRITGGNTNDGDADYYETAAAAYQGAIRVARLLERTTGDPGWWHGGDFEPLAHATGQPDYVLALFLAMKGEVFTYGREHEADLDETHEEPGLRFIGLHTLRRLAAERAASDG